MKKVSFAIFIIVALTTAMVLINIIHAEPKYLKKEEITKTMMEWNKALGVQCNFCHTANRSETYKDLAGKPVSKEELSTLVHQRIARAMLGDMLYMNQKEGKNYTCNTCHQGKAEVEVK